MLFFRGRPRGPNGPWHAGSAHHEVGECVTVVLPYEEGAVAIPVPAEVVRIDDVKGSMFQAVAIQLETAKG
ncbi:MAG: hypothetical protein LAP13_04685 [Acidobacteriia bacterium]|nr:hypothetical protein [Terriglobia bacterium]